jgi:hypothetical protein
MLKSFFQRFFQLIQNLLSFVWLFCRKVLNFLIVLILFIKNTLDNFNAVFPRTMEKIQITFVFGFALLDLIFSVLLNVYSFGYYPEMLMPVFPYIEALFLSPFFYFWASPEKVFFLSFLVIELMIARSVFRLSKFVKYYILLIFALLMIQGLSVSYWDLIFNREITHKMSKWALDQAIVIYTDKQLAIFFFFLTFICFIILYAYLYVWAMCGKIAPIPYTEWLTDSIAFWLKIKTPTMPFGTRKKENKKEKTVEEEEDFLDDLTDSEKDLNDIEEIDKKKKEDNLFDD